MFGLPSVTRARELPDPGTALSLVGRAVNSSGDHIDIASTGNGQYINRFSDVLAWRGLIVPNGTTVPSSPATGELFLHTPTGRSVLIQWNGTVWQPIISIGSMTMFVDGASGTDSIDKGFGTGTDAFDTIQFAINQIPVFFSGNVSITIAAGTYVEAVTIRGKNPTGSFTITLTGALTTLDSLTSSASTAGTGATQGTVVRSSGTWTTNARRNKLVRFTAGVNSGTTRVIDSNTTTTLTICGTWSGGAPGTDAFVVEDWGTIISPASGSVALTIGDGQVGVNVTGIKLVGTGTNITALVVGYLARLTLATRCWFDSSSSGLTVQNAGGRINATQCVVTIDSTAGFVFYSLTQSAFEFLHSRIEANAASTIAVLCQLQSLGSISRGTVIQGGSAGIGIYNDNSTINTDTGAATHGNTRIQGFVTGTKLLNDASVLQFQKDTYVTYASNTSDFVSETGPLFDSFADVGNVTTAETDLVSNTLVANQLLTNGDQLQAEYALSIAAHATNARTVKVKFAGTTIYDSTVGTPFTTVAAASMVIRATLIRVSSTVIRYSIGVNTTSALALAYAAVGELTGLSLSGTNILKITGTAVATNDIVAKASYVRSNPVLR